MEKRGILFDLDGTLWEVTDRTFESVNEIAKKHGLEEISKKTICGVFGLNKVEVAQMYFPKLDLKKSLDLVDEITSLNIKKLKKHGGNIYPNLEETLIELKSKYELFIVSNTSDKEYIEAFLTSSKLDKYFNDYIAASELNISKAEAIKRVIKNHKLENAIYVGDTKKDLEASNIAEIPFVQAKYGFGPDLKTKYRINEIKEIPKVVEEVYRKKEV